MEKVNTGNEIISCRLKELRDIVMSMPENTILCIEWENDENE